MAAMAARAAEILYGKDQDKLDMNYQISDLS
jgi:hypothetical protein